MYCTHYRILTRYTTFRPPYLIRENEEYYPNNICTNNELQNPWSWTQDMERQSHGQRQEQHMQFANGMSGKTADKPDNQYVCMCICINTLCRTKCKKTHNEFVCYFCAHGSERAVGPFRGTNEVSMSYFLIK